MGVDTEYDDWPSQNAGDRSAQVIQIDSGKHIAVVLICALISALAVSMLCVTAFFAYKAEREARMLQYYVNEVDGKLIHAGFIEARDRWGPEKRRQYEEKTP